MLNYQRVIVVPILSSQSMVTSQPIRPSCWRPGSNTMAFSETRLSHGTPKISWLIYVDIVDIIIFPIHFIFGIATNMSGSLASARAKRSSNGRCKPQVFGEELRRQAKECSKKQHGDGSKPVMTILYLLYLGE